MLCCDIQFKSSVLLLQLSTYSLTLSLAPLLTCLFCQLTSVRMQYECENVLNDAALMEACGVGLSRTDMYGVMMVCKQLGEDPKLGCCNCQILWQGTALILWQLEHHRALQIFIWQGCCTCQS